MAVALYRRYRPDVFQDVIGQDQTTIPLMRALDAGKITHAYLFSGPRGCGKTSSARILARCINCAEGPSSHPCGKCDSCRDLATGGPGSIDVVEIDAASHNGVEDARELRDRAGFAPARDRYKIFILDEAHMVTQQGFNALLKIVEEPPEHVLFIFATTEPEKVLGTIRSRTHHYPFRLVPSKIMLPFLEGVCEKENVVPESGVLRAVIRAGGGSVRDTLSVLDQLLISAKDGKIAYETAVALLGFTPEELISQTIDSIAKKDGSKLYSAVENVIAGGYDPKKFAEDLLNRVRDLTLINLVSGKAETVSSALADANNIDVLRSQAGEISLANLTEMAEIIDSAAASMSGSMSPAMRLELLAAKLMLAVQTDGYAASSSASLNAAGSAAAAVKNSEKDGAIGNAKGNVQNTARNVVQSVQNAKSANPVQTAGTAQFNVAQSDTAQLNIVQTGVQPQSVRKSQSESEHTGSKQPNIVGGLNKFFSGSSSSAGSKAQNENVSVQNMTAENVDKAWDSIVSGLPDMERIILGRKHVPSVELKEIRPGKFYLQIRFDEPLSQHVFSTRKTDDGQALPAVMQKQVATVFGENVLLAPGKTMDGQTVTPLRKLPEEDQKNIRTAVASRTMQLSLAATKAKSGTEPGNSAVKQNVKQDAKPAETSAVSDSKSSDSSHSSNSSQTSESDDEEPEGWGNTATVSATASATDSASAHPVQNIQSALSVRSEQSESKPEQSDPAQFESSQDDIPPADDFVSGDFAPGDFVPDDMSPTEAVDDSALSALPDEPPADFADPGFAEPEFAEPAEPVKPKFNGFSRDKLAELKNVVSERKNKAESEAAQKSAGKSQSAETSDKTSDKTQRTVKASQSSDSAHFVEKYESGNLESDNSETESEQSESKQSEKQSETENSNNSNNRENSKRELPEPKVSADEDTYSDDDEDLQVESEITIEDIKRKFNVTQTRFYEASDPKNPMKKKGRKKHADTV